MCSPCPLCGKPCTAHELNPAEAYCSHSLPRMDIHEWTRKEMELEEEEEEEMSYLDYMVSGGEGDMAILFFLPENQEMCKTFGIANGFKMLKLTILEELVEGVGRKQVEQKPSSEPQSKEDAAKVESADESEEPQKTSAKKRRRGHHGPARLKIESRIDFKVSAACHVFRLMARSVQAHAL